jgi:precorrin isomerase
MPAACPKSSAISGSDDIAEAVPRALAAGADIYCDVETLRYGVMRRLLPEGLRTALPDIGAGGGGDAKANA